MALSPRTILAINHNFRWIAAAFAVLLLVVGYLLVIVEPVRTVFTTEVEGIAKLKEQHERDQARLDSVTEFVGRFRSVTPDDIARAQRILPNEADLPLLYSQIPALVEDSGLQLDSLSVTAGASVPIDPGTGTSASVRGQSLGTVDVTLSITEAKSYADLQRFLDAVEKNLRVFDITAISFPTQPSVDQGPSVVIPGYSVTLRTYFFTPQS